MRKTKIIATIGPNSRDPKILDQLFDAGMDCARLNFSYGAMEEHSELIQTLRELSEKFGRPLAVLQDLGRIKLRLGRIQASVRLDQGEEVYLVSDGSSNQRDVVPFPQPAAFQTLQPGDLIYISDGTVCLEVIEAEGSRLKARVRTGGVMSSFAGVTLPGVTIDHPVLTEVDKIALQLGAEQEVDWVAFSYVRDAEDVRYVKAFLDSIGSKALILASLESKLGIDNIDSILEEASGVIIDRGDLGVKVPMEQIPNVQKQVIKKANEKAKVSIVATQLLSSMVVSPTPTRAEISDVSTAVLDGCDAILLSGETAVGRYPVEAVNVADSTIREAEKLYPYYKEYASHERTQAIAWAASRLVRVLDSRPIVITSAGRSAFAISQFRPNSNIIVYSHDEATLRRLCLGWGLSPAGVIPAETDLTKLLAMVIKTSLEAGLIQDTDTVTIVHGFMPGVSGTTNTIQILDMQEYLSSS